MSDTTTTILLVDDDVDFITQVQVQLEAAGYTVITAGSLADAEAIIAGTRPDLAILDLMMEHSDAGFVLAHKIKQLEPPPPVILVTAVMSEKGIGFDATTPEERSWVKADVVLDKPVRFEQLQREIERLL